jgi:hypothetical protein
MPLRIALYRHLQAVMDANLVPSLLAALMPVNELRVRKEATWAIANATMGGTVEQIQFLVERGCIKPLCDMLLTQDVKAISVSLDALANILKADRILHPNSKDFGPWPRVGAGAWVSLVVVVLMGGGGHASDSAVCRAGRRPRHHRGPAGAPR